MEARVRPVAGQRLPVAIDNGGASAREAGMNGAVRDAMRDRTVSAGAAGLRTLFAKVAGESVSDVVSGYDAYSRALSGASYRLDDVRSFVSGLSGAGPRQLGLFISAAVNKVIAESDTIELDMRGKSADYLGMNLSKGTVTVLGDAGDRVATFMSGGRLIVTGNVGRWAGSCMSGGTLIVHGNAGNALGYFVSEESKIVVLGDAGRGVGAHRHGGDIEVKGRAEAWGAIIRSDSIRH